MDQSLGSLVHWQFTEYLPFLAANIIAQDAFTQAVPGYILYNISDGIVAVDVTGWFCRWALAQTFSWHSSILFMSNKRPKPGQEGSARSLLLATLALCPCLAVAFLTGDWWAFANVTSMVISVVIRGILIGENRKAIDRATISTRDHDWGREHVKALLVIPDGRVVTIYAPRGILTDVLLTKPRPSSPSFYTFVRWIGWLGFGTHVVSLGMSALLNQILTVGLLLTSSILVGNRIGCDELSIGSQLEIKRFDERGGKESRARTYLRMDLSDSEEENLVAWGLFPRRSNQQWWARYRAMLMDSSRTEFETWMRSLPLPRDFHVAMNLSNRGH